MRGDEGLVSFLLVFLCDVGRKRGGCGSDVVWCGGRCATDEIFLEGVIREGGRKRRVDD